ncbi:MAG TPA: biotin/lipoyl-containing protein [Gemmatimonadaceae bacterium]|nr:biotin/lipoyl-containing protein [Gemmatimonadaceae bacterium]
MKYVVDVGGRNVDVELDGEQVTVNGTVLSASLSELTGTPIVLMSLGDSVHRVVVTRRPERGRYVLSLDGRRYEVEALDERTRAIRQLSNHASGPKGPAPLVAPMPGLIVRVSVEVGASVQPGQGLVVMEAMKMENELRSSSAGVVRAIRAAAGTAVERGAVLVELE